MNNIHWKGIGLATMSALCSGISFGMSLGMPSLRISAFNATLSNGTVTDIQDLISRIEETNGVLNLYASIVPVTSMLATPIAVAALNFWPNIRRQNEWLEDMSITRMERILDRSTYCVTFFILGGTLVAGVATLAYTRFMFPLETTQ